MTLCTNITKRLRLLKISQRQFYKDLELPNNSLSQWNKRNTIPNALILYNIAKYLNCRIEDLLGVEYL